MTQTPKLHNCLIGSSFKDLSKIKNRFIVQSGFFSYFSKILNLQCKASVTMMGRLMNHSNWQHPLGKRLFWKHFFCCCWCFFYFHSTKKFSWWIKIEKMSNSIVTNRTTLWYCQLSNHIFVIFAMFTFPSIFFHFRNSSCLSTNRQKFIGKNTKSFWTFLQKKKLGHVFRPQCKTHQLSFKQDKVTTIA